MQLMNIRYQTIANFHVEDFSGVIIDWVRNTYDLRYQMHFEEVEFTGYQIYRDGERELTIVEYKEADTIAALHRNRDIYGTEWQLSIVFKPLSQEIYIRMINSQSTGDGRFMLNFRKPDIIEELISLKIVEKDCDFTISNEPLIIKKNQISPFLDVLNRKARFMLPVIYVALGPYDVYATDPWKLADDYAGLAHVFVQTDRDCFGDLIGGTKELVPKYGEVAIYYPNDTNRETHLLFNRYDRASMGRAISHSIHFFYHNQNFGPLTTYEEIASKAIALRNLSLREENSEVYRENARVNKENSDLFNTFDHDLRKSDEEIERLRKRMRELETENEILKKRIEANTAKPLLFYGPEKELYASEIKEILADVLENTPTIEGSRRKHLIKDLLKANDVKPTIKQRHAKIKAALADYREMSADTRRELTELGFTIISEGKHHKLIYHDDARYQLSIPRTSSDHRAGLNAAAYIIKNMM